MPNNKLLYSKPIVDKIYADLTQKISTLSTPPTLVFILVGEHSASQTYVNMKTRRCKLIGMHSKLIQFPHDVSLMELQDTLHQLSISPEVSGVIVQQPLPTHLDPIAVMEALDPTKDVDGLHPMNMGKILLGVKPFFYPCTPLGILELLNYYEISLEGKHLVILGRSNIVSKPLAAMALQKQSGLNATVTIAHSQSRNIQELTRQADVLIAAIGQAQKIDGSYLKPHSIAIDVGINRIDGKVIGDIHTEQALNICSKVTPVPGGVGPLTIAMLLKNTVEACLLQ